MAITPLPEPAPQRGQDRTTFTNSANALVAALPTMVSEINTTTTNIDNAATQVEEDANQASADASRAENAAEAAEQASNVTAWASGSDYVQGNVVYSLVNFLTYRAKVNITNSTTDPSADSTNWVRLGYTLDTDDSPSLIADLDFDNNDIRNARLGTDLNCQGGAFQQSAYRQIDDISISTGTYAFDYSNGDVQKVTATGDFTLSFSNFPTGKVVFANIEAVDWGSHTVTFPTGVRFIDGTAPEFTTDGTDELIIKKDDDEVYSIIVHLNMGSV